MESLYRKYRPLTFESVVGQQHIVSTLEHAITEGRLSHAYLFCGPRGTGKTTMARIVAKALLCERAAEARAAGASGCLPDGSCEECQRIAEGAHPDVYELDAASRTGVDNVREEIINSVSFAPVRGAYKIYIIDEVHMLTTQAFNALLKTLEEPPEHVVFVLCTTDPQKIPETILSRCQRFDFHRIGNEDIVGRLRYICEQEGFDYDAEALEIVAKHARGGMRDALSTLEQLSVFGNGSVHAADARALLGEVSGTVLSEFSRAIAARDVATLFGLVRAQVDAGEDLMELTRDLVAHVRDIYMVRVAGARPELFDGGEEDVAALAEESGLFETADRLARVLTVLDDAALEMRSAADTRLVLEIALTRLARPESDLSLEALAERVDRLEARIASGVPAAPLDANGVAALTGSAGVGAGTAGANAESAGSPNDSVSSHRGAPQDAVIAAGVPAASTGVSSAPTAAARQGAASRQESASDQEKASVVHTAAGPSGVASSASAPGARQGVASGSGSAPSREVPAAPATSGASGSVSPASAAPVSAAPAPAPAASAPAAPASSSAAPASALTSSAPASTAAASAASASSVAAPAAPARPSAAAVAASAAASTPAVTDPGELQRKWADVVKRVTAAQPSRGALLQSSRAQSDDGSSLTVSFPAGSGFAITMLGRPDTQEVVLPQVCAVFGNRAVHYVMDGGASKSAASEPSHAVSGAAPAASIAAAPAPVGPAPATSAPETSVAASSAADPASKQAPAPAPERVAAPGPGMMPPVPGESSAPVAQQPVSQATAPKQRDESSAPARSMDSPAASPTAPASAWDGDQVPYDDVTAASYDEDDLPPFDMPAEQVAPVGSVPAAPDASTASSASAMASAPAPSSAPWESASTASAPAPAPAPVPASAPAVPLGGDASESGAADVASILGNVFGEGVKLTQVNGTE